MVNCYHSLDDTDTETVAINSVLFMSLAGSSVFKFEDHDRLRYSLFDSMVSQNLVIDFIRKYSTVKKDIQAYSLEKSS